MHLSVCKNFVLKASASIPDDLPYVFVHHTAMGECNNFATCVQRVQEVQVSSIHTYQTYTFLYSLREKSSNSD